MFHRFLNKAAELLAKGELFVTASVVRFQAPISCKPGGKAIIFADGKMWAWIGGGCARPVRSPLLRAGTLSECLG